MWHFMIYNRPQLNGVAESMDRPILDKIHCTLSNTGLGKEFWAEVGLYERYLINCLPSTAIARILVEMWTEELAIDYDSLHVFGSHYILLCK